METLGGFFRLARTRELLYSSIVYSAPLGATKDRNENDRQTAWPVQKQIARKRQILEKGIVIYRADNTHIKEWYRYEMDR